MLARWNKKEESKKKVAKDKPVGKKQKLGEVQASQAELNMEG